MSGVILVYNHKAHSESALLLDMTKYTFISFDKVGNICWRVGEIRFAIHHLLAGSRELWFGGFVSDACRTGERV